MFVPPTWTARDRSRAGNPPPVNRSRPALGVIAPVRPSSDSRRSAGLTAWALPAPALRRLGNDKVDRATGHGPANRAEKPVPVR
jgi:hypothetical protein